MNDRSLYEYWTLIPLLTPELEQIINYLRLCKEQNKEMEEGISRLEFKFMVLLEATKYRGYLNAGN